MREHSFNYVQRGVEADVITQVEAILNDPTAPLIIYLLIGRPGHGVRTALVHGIVPEIPN